MVFLGGTCNKSTWREELIPLLEQNDIPYFNPVVDDWNEAAQEKEKEVKACPTTIELYVITCQMTGAFSIAEVVDASNKTPKTIFMVQPEGFTDGQIKSLNAVKDLVEKNGAIVVNSYEDIVTAAKKLRK